MIIHTVKKGDTIYSISKQYGLSPAYIESINNMPNPENLIVGQSVLLLFPDVIHTVMAGDSLFSISQMYSTTVKEILRNNPLLSKSSTLYPGQQIVISFTGQHELNKNIIVNAYTYANLTSDYLKTVLPYLTYITSFTYGINEDGSLIAVEDNDIISLAKIYGVSPLMHLSTLTNEGVFSNELAGRILTNPALQEIIAENVLNEIKLKGYDGLDIDFEFLPPENKNEYAKFVTMLREKLNKEGYIVIVALAPKTSSDQKGILYEGHDYEKLGKAANLSFVMTYEWGYTYGPPMAVSPIESVKNVLDYAVSEINPEKILMGIPSYGYNWTLPYIKGDSMAISISTNEAIETALKYKSDIYFDTFSKTPYFYYTDEEDRIHNVWFEDALSIYEKLKLIYEYNIAGCGYWNLERPFTQNWMILNYMYNIL